MRLVMFSLMLLAIVCHASRTPEKVNLNDDSCIISMAVRNVDLTSQLVKEKAALDFEATGNKLPSYVLLAMPRKKMDHLAFYNVHFDSPKTTLQVDRVEVSGHDDVAFLKVTLPARNERKVKVIAEFVYGDWLKPFPTHITQKGRQFFIYDDLTYMLSPYEVKKQKMIIKLYSENVESYTKKVLPVVKSGKILTYGIYENISSFIMEPMRVHFESYAPFLVVTELERIIEISHWGNIAVEEHIHLEHRGAVLTGPFSRLDYQRSQRQISPSVSGFRVFIPQYYQLLQSIYIIETKLAMFPLVKCVIIQTLSILQYNLDFHCLAAGEPAILLVTIFLVMNIYITQVYSLSLNFNLICNVTNICKAGSQFGLKMRFVDHVFENFFIENFLLKIILPEESKNIRVKPPYDVEQYPNSLHYTYLDVTGRPVITMRKRHLVENHIQDFELYYTWESSKIVREPIMVAVAFMVFFCTIIFFVRLDFSIVKDTSAESRMKLDSLTDEIAEAHQKRGKIYEQIVENLEKYTSSKDNAIFGATKKRLDQEWRNLNQHIMELQSQLKVESSEAAEKVSMIQRMDQQVRESFTSWNHDAERHVSGKLNRQSYTEASNQVRTKIEDLSEKMNHILYSI
ncbi:Dolichyl-diphosphooligosaccharide--protein glycosyltransferase subunit 1 [Trichinella pseudospiralis]|uniref:Dolichyl-diphosphooligosaccharide--protein glycosyltransferase subunit 1 n=1 Tax=Trichinella pseudospiralis TaxID=6337 RepID=A0A0V0Y8A4_TRIPS|nr:Dolichyl-diphosphooligosaccharide--protein glycosyltransferase subunit 1 [Trichinella pseudospiralis]